MLYELIYRSLGFKEWDTEELSELLEISKIRNREAGITGMLLYHNQEFMQLIEGEREAVLSLYREIVKDDRHHLVHVIWEGYIQERGFDDWTMGFVDTREHKLSLPEGHTNFLEDGILTGSRKNPTVCKCLLVHLRDTLTIAPTIPTF